MPFAWSIICQGTMVRCKLSAAFVVFCSGHLREAQGRLGFGSGAGSRWSIDMTGCICQWLGMSSLYADPLYADLPTRSITEKGPANWGPYLGDIVDGISYPLVQSQVYLIVGLGLCRSWMLNWLAYIPWRTRAFYGLPLRLWCLIGSSLFVTFTS